MRGQAPRWIAAGPTVDRPRRAQVTAVVVLELVNNATFVSQTVPTTMTAGQSYGVTLRMSNTGNTPWDAPDVIRLGSQNPQDNLAWGMNRVSMPAASSIDPNQEVT